MQSNPFNFLILLLCTLCGFGRVSWSVVVPAALAGMLLLSWTKYEPMLGKARGLGVEASFWKVFALSATNSTFAIVGTYVLGWSVRTVLMGSSVM